jgi:putative transcriptional regulator
MLTPNNGPVFRPIIKKRRRNDSYVLGRFVRKEDAVAAHKEAEKRIFGDFGEWYNAIYKGDEKMSINDKNFYTLWGEALASSDRDLFVSEWSTSSIWGVPEVLTDDELIEIAKYLAKLWDAAHLTIKDIRTNVGMTQIAFATRFCIPLRTVVDWDRGVRTPPDYVRLLIIQHLSLL